MKIKARQNEIEQSYIRLHALGMLVSVGVNSPKDYPKLDKFLPRSQTVKKLSDEQKKYLKERAAMRTSKLKEGD